MELSLDTVNSGKQSDQRRQNVAIAKSGQKAKKRSALDHIEITKPIILSREKPKQRRHKLFTLRRSSRYTVDEPSELRALMLRKLLSKQKAL